MSSALHKTIADDGSYCAELQVKSRFVGCLARVDSWAQAQNYLSTIQTQHPKARHWCFAYCDSTGGGGANKPVVTERFLDDGERSGTAGAPILNAIHGERLSDAMLVGCNACLGTVLWWHQAWDGWSRSGLWIGRSTGTATSAGTSIAAAIQSSSDGTSRSLVRSSGNSERTMPWRPSLLLVEGTTRNHPARCKCSQNFPLVLNHWNCLASINHKETICILLVGHAPYSR
jgi:Uncharacterized protein family UPF0029